MRADDGAARRFSLRRWRDDGGDVHWADNRTLMYLPGGGDDDRAHVLRLPRLERVGGFRGWYTGTSFVRNGCARGWAGARCSPACLPDGPVRTEALLGPDVRRDPGVGPCHGGVRRIVRSQGVAAGLASE